MKRLFLLSITLLAVLSTTTLRAQVPVWAEIRPHVAMPFAEVTKSVDLKTGIGTEVIAGYRFMDLLSAYVGYNYTRFSAKSIANRYTETGITAGVRYANIEEGVPMYYVGSAGVVYNQINVRRMGEGFDAKSNSGIGWQVEAGIGYKFTESLAFLPTIRYHSLGSRITYPNNPEMNIKLDYLSFGIAVNYSF